MDAVLVKQLEEKRQRRLEEVALEKQASPSCFFCCKPAAGNMFVPRELTMKTKQHDALSLCAENSSQLKLG